MKWFKWIGTEGVLSISWNHFLFFFCLRNTFRGPILTIFRKYGWNRKGELCACCKAGYKRFKFGEFNPNFIFIFFSELSTSVCSLHHHKRGFLVAATETRPSIWGNLRKFYSSHRFEIVWVLSCGFLIIWMLEFVSEVLVE